MRLHRRRRRARPLLLCGDRPGRQGEKGRLGSGIVVGATPPVCCFWSKSAANHPQWLEYSSTRQRARNRPSRKPVSPSSACIIRSRSGSNKFPHRNPTARAYRGPRQYCETVAIAGLFRGNVWITGSVQVSADAPCWRLVRPCTGIQGNRQGVCCGSCVAAKPDVAFGIEEVVRYTCGPMDGHYSEFALRGRSSAVDN